MSPYGLTPTKPLVPARIVRERVPEPVDPEDGEILSPVDPPSAHELLPLAPAPPFDTAPHDPVSPYEDSALRQALWTQDPVKRLGASAVASANLSAAGARTPLGGVPRVPADDHVEAPAFGDDTPAFMPVFASKHNEEHTMTGPTDPGVIRDAAAALGDEDVPGYEPTTAANAEAAADGGENIDGGAGASTGAHEPDAVGGDDGARTPPATPADEEPPGRGRRLMWLWIVLGALVVLGVTGIVLAKTVFATPDPIIQPGVTVTEPPPTPTISPLAIASPTPFLAAMPGTVGTYSLTAAAPADKLDAATYGRTAEAHQLTYRSGANEASVLALQYYNEADATAAWGTLTGPAADATTVTAGGVEVGQKASVTDPAPGIVWRNGTAVFVLTGPATELEAFYEFFGH